MPHFQMSEEEYERLMERIYKIIARTEELDQVTHHYVWEVWRLLYHSKLDKTVI